MVLTDWVLDVAQEGVVRGVAAAAVVVRGVAAATGTGALVERGVTRLGSRGLKMPTEVNKYNTYFQAGHHF